MSAAQAEQRQRDPLVGFLRALGSALGVVRLHPDEPTRPEVAAAVARARDAADGALVGGPVHATVTAEGLQVGGGLLTTDPHLDRLARACFERRIEHVALEDVPSQTDILAALDVLTRPAVAVETPHGRREHLAARGVTSIRLATGMPEPTSGRSVPTGELADDESAGHADPPAPEIVDIAVDAEGAHTAAALYARLRDAHDRLADDLAGRSTFFARAAEAVAALPPGERATFAALATQQLDADAFARRYLGHLTDLAFASLTLDVAATGGSDPIAVAQRLVLRTGRRPEVVQLVDAAASGSALDRAEGPRSALEIDDATLSVLRGEFPADPEALRTLSLRVLRDYAMLEDDPERLGRVLDAVSARLRDACAARDRDEVVRLLAALEDIADGVGPEYAHHVTSHRRAVLDPELLVPMAVAAIADDDVAAVTRTLEPFGQDAVDALVATLVEAEEASVRGVVTSVLAAIARADVARLAPHLTHPRWYVARNLATALGRIGTPAAVAPLERLARHDHRAVRHEATKALVGVTAPAAADALARLARRAGPADVRAAYVDALAAHPASEAADLLAELGRRGSGPRLPWRLRRRARAHVRTRRQSA